ncbi:MAG: flagellar hook-length control protein FliK [Hyphomonadaceae bacterium]|nr:flagellar hook-length control protein FliK [Hyphomonadaceae bacterium]
MISVLLPESPSAQKAQTPKGSDPAAEASGKEDRFSDFLANEPTDERTDGILSRDPVAPIETNAPKPPALGDAETLIPLQSDVITLSTPDATVEADNPTLRLATNGADGLAMQPSTSPAETMTAAPDTVPQGSIQKAEVTAAAPDLPKAQLSAAPDGENAPKTTPELTEIRGQAAPAGSVQADDQIQPPLSASRETPEADIRNASAEPDTLADLDVRAPRTAAPSITEASPVASLLTRETPTITPDTQLNIVPAPAPATGAPVAPNGLTPTAPMQVIAAPNELSAVIVNALQGGLDPKEQIVVQLDPPELGRVLIDFKFDAQGVQQITITSENPEALKRLRELHFELTQALKDFGLSDQNMSFQQHADQRPNSNPPNADWAQLSSPGAAKDTVTVSRSSSSPSPSNALAKDRLDLLL